MEDIEYLGESISSSERLESVFKEAKKGKIDLSEDIIKKAIMDNREAFKNFINKKIDDDKELGKLLKDEKYGDIGFEAVTQEFSKDYVNRKGLSETYGAFKEGMKKMTESWVKYVNIDLESIRRSNNIATWILNNATEVRKIAELSGDLTEFDKNPQKWKSEHLTQINDYVVVHKLNTPQHIGYYSAYSRVTEYLEICKMMYLGEKYINGYKGGFVEYMKTETEFSPKAIALVKEVISNVLFKSFIWNALLSEYPEHALKEEGQDWLAEVFPEMQTYMIKKAMHIKK